jgi:drug/metabolite transporter (DMT)-like permease
VWAALIAVYIVWGSTYLAIAVAVETIPPFSMAAVRFLVAGALMLGWAVWRGDLRGERIGWPQVRASVLIGGLLLLGGNGGVAWAEQRVASGVAALIIASTPMWMAMFGRLGGHETIRPATLAGLAAGFLGIAMLVRVGGSDDGSVDPLGVTVLIVAAISWALGSVLSIRAALPSRPVVSTSLQMLAGGALLGVAGLASGETGELRLPEVSFASVGALLYLIVFGSFVAFLAYVWLLQNARPSLVSTYAYVNPVVAVFLGWLLRDERVTGLTVLAAALIVGAVALIGRRRGEEPVLPPAGSDGERSNAARVG